MVFFQDRISNNTDTLANVTDHLAIVTDNLAIVTDNLANVTDNLAKAEEAQNLCPSQYQDDSRYKLVDNHCFYLEKNTLSFDAAENNCKEKLGSFGRLYEPKSIEEMEKLATLANNLQDSNTWVWLGVTDKRIENQWAYNSNGLPIKFNPNWYSNYGSKGKGYDCVIMSTSSGRNYFKLWADADKNCLTPRSSICQSIT